jgi:hypothetical protein
VAGDKVQDRATQAAVAELTLKNRVGAYRAVFDINGPRTREVLVDLARFCRANESTFHPDARVSAQLDGRREVWLRIQQHLKLTDDQLWALFVGPRS